MVEWKNSFGLLQTKIESRNPWLNSNPRAVYFARVSRLSEQCTSHLCDIQILCVYRERVRSFAFRLVRNFELYSIFRRVSSMRDEHPAGKLRGNCATRCFAVVVETCTNISENHPAKENQKTGNYCIDFVRVTT